MSDEGKGKKPRRRRFQLDGETEAAPESTRSKPREIDEIFGLEKEGELPEDAEVAVAMQPESRIRQFIAGKITLGDLEGVTKPEQYKIAEVGHSHLEGGKLDQARVVFEGLLALDPFDAYFRTALASIAQQEGRLKDADEMYTRVLEINPYSPTAYANRGEVRVMLGRLAEGAEDLIRAVTEDPKAVEPATARARATLLVLQEQLGAMVDGDVAERAREATDSKVEAVGRAVARGGPRPRPRPRARPRPRGRASGRRPGPRRKKP